MSYILAAVAAQGAGPFLLALLGRRPRLIPFLDGFVVAAIPGLIFLHFVPGAVEEGAFLTLVALGLGFALPTLSEKVFRDAHGQTDRAALLLGVAGLALHAALDGAALTGLQGRQGLAFGAAIILHRVPVGLAVWWLVVSRMGRNQAVVSILVLMSVTVMGWLGGTGLATLAGTGPMELFQALVGGSLIHVAFHKPHEQAVTSPVTPASRRAEGSGAILALLILVGLVLLEETQGGHAGGAGFLDRLMILTAESAPALLLAYLFAGVLSAFLPSTSIRWMSRGGPISSAGRGMLVGLPLPICSCGVVPLYRTLVQRGAPPAAAMAFLVATPELGLDAIFLSIPLLGPHMTVLRLAAAGVAALLVGWWVGGRLKARKALSVVEAEGAARPGVGARTREALRTGLGDVVDHTAPWIAVGLLIAALAAPLLEGGGLGQLPPVADVFLFALLGFPTYVCASSATPLVATFLATGLSPGAAVAFLITGPATNATTVGVVAGVHGRRVALTFAGTLVGLAVTMGLTINALVGRVPVPSLEQLVEEMPGPLQQGALVLLVLLFLSSIFRRGIRSFVSELKEGLLVREHDHGGHSGHDHGSEHGSAHRAGDGGEPLVTCEKEDCGCRPFLEEGLATGTGEPPPPPPGRE